MISDYRRDSVNLEQSNGVVSGDMADNIARKDLVPIDQDDPANARLSKRQRGMTTEGANTEHSNRLRLKGSGVRPSPEDKGCQVNRPRSEGLQGEGLARSPNGEDEQMTLVGAVPAQEHEID
jgi:hypothetical protein